MFTSQITELPNFVLLGLPASESGNALLVPLAGHELGHTAWQSRFLRVRYAPIIEKIITDEVVNRTPEYSTLFGGAFNDLFMKQNVSSRPRMGVEADRRDVLRLHWSASVCRVFSARICLPFVPGLDTKRSPRYPTLKNRCSNLEIAAKEYGVTLPANFKQWFADEAPATTEPKETFLVMLADTAASALVTDIVMKAEEIASTATMPERSAERIAASVEAFRLLTPATAAGGLVEFAECRLASLSRC